MDTPPGSAAERRTRALLAGRGSFVGDLRSPTTLEAMIVRSEAPHGRLTRIEADRARSMPGVKAVLTSADLADVPLLPVRGVSSPGLEARRQPVLADGVVRYVGQPVAVIVAQDRYAAEDAAEQVRVSVEPRQPVTQAQVEPHRGGPSHVSDESYFELKSGDLGPDGRGRRLGRWTFDSGRQTALPLETRGLLAEQRDDGLHIWGLTKYVLTVRGIIADFFGLEHESVLCHHVDVGGMFGVRGEVYPEDFLVPWAARVLGRPVIWIEDRREHLLSTNHSRQQQHVFSISLDDEGRLHDFDDDLVVDLGAYAGGIGTRLAGMTVESLPGPYRWKGGYRVRCRGLRTNKTPVGVMRGPGTAEATFVRERAIDIAARTHGLDPIELRLCSLLAADDLPHRLRLSPDLAPVVYEQGDFHTSARTFLQSAGLERLRADVWTRRRRGERVGLGCAFFVAPSGSGRQESIRLSLREDGSFAVATTANEVGQGLVAMAGIVGSQALGVPIDRIDVIHGDSRSNAHGSGTYGSRTTIFVGNAIVHAAGLLLDRARSRLSDEWDVPRTEILHDGEGFFAGPRRIRWKELAPMEAEGNHRWEDPVHGFGAHLALVSIDTATAASRLERLWVGYDCGRVIDRVGAHQQMVGASVQAVGGALLEALSFDASGQPQVTTLLDYLVPSAMEAPYVEVFLLETTRAGNPLGARGIGEAGVYGVAAAVTNAIADALDVAQGLTKLPVGPDELFPLLDSASGRRQP